LILWPFYPFAWQICTILANYVGENLLCVADPS
jgi:hypothetical protein